MSTLSNYANKVYNVPTLKHYNIYELISPLDPGKPVKVRLTSDSPAIKGSMVSFTAKLEYPPCQKEDTNGELVWDEHCPDGMELEASGPSHDCKRDCH